MVAGRAGYTVRCGKNAKWPLSGCGVGGRKLLLTGMLIIIFLVFIAFLEGLRRSCQLGSPYGSSLSAYLVGLALFATDGWVVSSREQPAGAKRPWDLETLADYIPCGIIVTDREGCVRIVNNAAAEMLDLDCAAVMGQLLGTVLADLQSGEDCLRHLLTLDQEISGYGLSVMHRSGRTCELLVDKHFLRDHTGTVTATILATQDVTRLNELERNVRRAERLAILGELAAATAHEIRNPLTTIRGFVQLYQYKLNKAADQELFNMVLAEIDRANNIIREFLLLAKPGEPKLAYCSVNALLTDTILLLKNEALFHNVELESTFAPHLPLVRCDAEQLKQVFLNISSNALHAMPEGGTLRITTGYHPEEEKIAITFTDTGCGISPENMEKIFQPFFSTREDGTGLGLAISYRIIKEHGGVIRVTSELGRGTTFTILLQAHGG